MHKDKTDLCASMACSIARKIEMSVSVIGNDPVDRINLMTLLVLLSY